MITQKNHKIHAWRDNQAYIHTFQGESGVKTVKFQLTDDNGNISLSDASSIAYQAKLPNNKSVFINCNISDSNQGIISFTIPTGITRYVGNTIGTIAVTTSNGTLKFGSVIIKVAPNDDSDIEATEQFSALEEALHKIALITPEGTIEVTDTVAANDYKPVTSNAVYNSLENKADKSTVNTKQSLANMFSTKQNLSNKESSYPSIKYLENYYYDIDYVDDLLDEKANIIDVNAALAKLSNNVTLEVEHKQTAYYETDTITTIEDLIALNGSKAVYSGVMSGFSTVFGQSSDDKYIGFRMWFMRKSSNTTSTYRFILLQDGSIWYASNASSTLFRQLTYSKTQVDNLLDEKQNVQYLTDTVTTIDDFMAYNQTNTVYTGRMKGFSTKFGESSDTVVKGFRMWFVLSGTDNPTWYRIVLFDDGTIWTALRSGTTFTQRSYTKNQIDKLLTEKADLDACENVNCISEQITSSGILNQFFADKNKMYVFAAIPPLSTELGVTATSQFELHNYENYQILRAIGYPNKSDGNKTFMRVYNEADNTWDGFVDCTLPDNYIAKTKLSDELQSEINGKFNSSGIETGSGKFTTTSVRISSANFEYQKIGDYVTMNIFVSFAESSMGATTSIQLTGMPFINESSGILRLPCATSKKTSLIVALGKNIVNILTSEAVAFSADETMGITITYKITKTSES